MQFNHQRHRRFLGLAPILADCPVNQHRQKYGVSVLLWDHLLRSYDRIAVLAIVLPIPTSRLSTMITCLPEFTRRWAISAPDTPPPTTATSQRMFFESFLWPAIRFRFRSHTGRPVRRSKLILHSQRHSARFEVRTWHERRSVGSLWNPRPLAEK